MSCRMKKLCTLLGCTFFSLSLSACSSQNVSSLSSTESTQSVVADAVSTAELLSYEDMFTDRDLNADYDASSAVSILLADDASSCTSSSVSISGNNITIKAGGTYLISGSLSEGQIVVNAADEKVQLVLDGADISNTASAAIYVQDADKVFVTLAENSDNILTSSGEFVSTDDNNVDGVIFSKDDLTLNGNGSLTINCETGHGIVSKDDLKITSGTYTITACKHALSGKDSVRIAGGTFNLNAQKDGLHSENNDDETKGYVYIADGTFTIDSEDDGISASSLIQIDDGTFQVTTADDSIHSDDNITVLDGTFTIASGDDGFHADADLCIHGGDITITESYEGLEGNTVTITDGNISVTSSDDGLNAAGGSDQSGFDGPMGRDRFSSSSSDSCQIIISGGYLVVDAQGDGLDSNGTLTIEGGEIYVSGPSDNANAAIDYETNATITGGIVVAAGSSGMAENFGSDSTQGAMLVTFNSSLEGTVTLSDDAGNELLSYTPKRTYNCVVISSPDIVEGNTYTVSCGTESTSVEMTSLIYGSSGMGGMGGFGHMGGMGDMKDGNRPDDTMTAPDGSTPDDAGTPPDDTDFDKDMTPPDGSTPDGTMTRPDGSAPDDNMTDPGQRPNEMKGGKDETFNPDSDADTSADNTNLL